MDDPNGALLTPASVGAPVSGFFRYDGSAHYSPGHLDRHVTAYLNDRSISPQLTDLGLTIGGAPLSAASYGTTNLQVGDNEPPGSPFWPAGDFFRYVDTIAFGPGLAALADLDGLEDEGFSPDQSAAINLSDPTGTAFSSQALPAVLTLAALADAGGVFSGFNDNTGSTLYSVSFRIDSIQGVPEPGSAVLAVAGAMGVSLAAWASRRHRRVGGARADGEGGSPGMAPNHRVRCRRTEERKSAVGSCPAGEPDSTRTPAQLRGQSVPVA